MEGEHRSLTDGGLKYQGISIFVSDINTAANFLDLHLALADLQGNYKKHIDMYLIYYKFSVLLYQ